MKKLLLNIGLGSLTIGGAIAVPLTLTSCSKSQNPQNFTLDTSDITNDGYSDYYYAHNFFGSIHNGALVWSEAEANLIAWGYESGDYCEMVYFFKSKTGVNSYVGYLKDIVGVDKTLCKKLKNGETITLSYDDCVIKLKLMILTNFDEVYSYISQIII